MTNRINKQKKRQQVELEKEAKHGIVCHYLWETQNHDKLQPVSKQQVFNNIFQRVIQHYDLPDTFSFPYSTALSRIRQGRLKANGNDSPLLIIEPKIVELAICMSKLKRSLTCSDGLRLVNELINGT